MAEWLKFTFYGYGYGNSYATTLTAGYAVDRGEATAEQEVRVVGSEPRSKELQEGQRGDTEGA